MKFVYHSIGCQSSFKSLFLYVVFEEQFICFCKRKQADNDVISLPGAIRVSISCLSARAPNE